MDEGGEEGCGTLWQCSNSLRWQSCKRLAVITHRKAFSNGVEFSHTSLESVVISAAWL